MLNAPQKLRLLKFTEKVYNDFSYLKPEEIFILLNGEKYNLKKIKTLYESLLENSAFKSLAKKLHFNLYSERRLCALITVLFLKKEFGFKEEIEKIIKSKKNILPISKENMDKLMNIINHLTVEYRLNPPKEWVINNKKYDFNNVIIGFAYLKNHDFIFRRITERLPLNKKIKEQIPALIMTLYTHREFGLRDKIKRVF